MKKRFLLGPATLIALAVIGWRVSLRSSAPLAGGAPPATSNQVAARAAAPVALELVSDDLVTAQRVSMTRSVQVSGSVRAVQSAWVKAKVPGELVRLSVREGDSVKAGQTIGLIDTTEVDLRLRQSEQQAQSAKAQLDIAERALKNNKALVDQGFISSTALETSVANDAAAQANWRAAQSAVALARKSQSDAVLKSPLSGTVAQRSAQTGERVAVEARIVEVVDLTAMEVEVALTPQDASAVAVGQTAHLQVEGMASALEAKVTRVSPVAQSGSRAILAYLTLNKASGLRQGLFAQGRIDIDERNALAVPETVIRLDGPAPSVPVVMDGVVRNKVVKLGGQGQFQGRAMREVLEGIAPGERVLAAGVGLVRDGTLVRVAATKP